MRRGVTLPESIVVVTIVGVLIGMAGLRVGRLRDGIAVRNAASEVIATFAAARRWALSRSTRTAVMIDTARAALVVRSYDDTVARRLLGSSHGVTMSATRDSMAYAPNGLGYGASNLTIVLRRGERAETVVVSRLGRVRR